MAALDGGLHVEPVNGNDILPLDIATLYFPGMCAAVN